MTVFRWLGSSLALLLSLCLSTQIYALPTTYYPFEYNDRDLYQRKDIQKVIDELKVEYNSASLTSSELETIPMADVQLTFFKDIADLMQDFEASKDRGPQPTRAPRSFYDEGCAAHQTLEPVLTDISGDSHSCSVLKQKLRAAHARSQQACLDIYEPERYVLRHPPGEVSFWKLTELKGLIATAGEALSDLDLPAPFSTPQFKSRMRTILMKVRMDESKEALQESFNTYKELLADAEPMPTSCNFTVHQKTVPVSDGVQALMNDISVAWDELTQVEQRGLEQAKSDRQKISAAGRKRNELPYPSLTDREREILSMYIGAVYWRMRGGGIVSDPPGTQRGRIYFTMVPFSALGYLNGGSEGRRMAQGIFWRVFQGWGQWMDMGRTKGENDKYYDLAYMTDRGQYQVGSTVTALINNAYDPTALKMGGLQMGPCYYYSWERLHDYLIAPDRPEPYKGFIDGATSWGEMCTGGAIALGLSRSLLKGKNPRSSFYKDPRFCHTCGD